MESVASTVVSKDSVKANLPSHARMMLAGLRMRKTSSAFRKEMAKVEERQPKAVTFAPTPEKQLQELLPILEVTDACGLLTESGSFSSEESSDMFLPAHDSVVKRNTLTRELSGMREESNARRTSISRDLSEADKSQRKASPKKRDRAPSLLHRYSPMPHLQDVFGRLELNEAEELKTMEPVQRSDGYSISEETDDFSEDLRFESVALEQVNQQPENGAPETNFNAIFRGPLSIFENVTIPIKRIDTGQLQQTCDCASTPQPFRNLKERILAPEKKETPTDISLLRLQEEEIDTDESSKHSSQTSGTRRAFDVSLVLGLDEQGMSPLDENIIEWTLSDHQLQHEEVAGIESQAGSDAISVTHLPSFSMNVVAKPPTSPKRSTRSTRMIKPARKKEDTLPGKKKRRSSKLELFMEESRRVAAAESVGGDVLDLTKPPSSQHTPAYAGSSLQKETPPPRDQFHDKHNWSSIGYTQRKHLWSANDTHSVVTAPPPRAAPVSSSPPILRSRSTDGVEHDGKESLSRKRTPRVQIEVIRTPTPGDDLSSKASSRFIRRSSSLPTMQSSDSSQELSLDDEESFVDDPDRDFAPTEILSTKGLSIFSQEMRHLLETLSPAQSLSGK